ncbi:hypothetical protein [Parasphingorhabdus sp.]|uniref:hypothetical protein n=1 Tax=Parasphingorhabdus sp. TaxID=2709688 RepID=UPI0030011125
MKMMDQAKPPIWFWIVGVIALLWNGIGLSAYFGQVMMSAEDFAALPEMQQDLLAAQPIWFTAAFAIAVFSGFVASVCWLLKKRIAVRLFLVSLLAVIVQFSGYFILDGYTEQMAAAGWLMPGLIVIFAVVWLLIAQQTEKMGVLR